MTGFTDPGSDHVGSARPVDTSCSRGAVRGRELSVAPLAGEGDGARDVSSNVGLGDGLPRRPRRSPPLRPRHQEPFVWSPLRVERSSPAAHDRRLLSGQQVDDHEPSWNSWTRLMRTGCCPQERLDRAEGPSVPPSSPSPRPAPRRRDLVISHRHVTSRGRHQTCGGPPAEMVAPKSATRASHPRRQQRRGRGTRPG